MPEDRVTPLLQEADELVVIMVSSIRTAKENRQSQIGDRK